MSEPKVIHLQAPNQCGSYPFSAVQRLPPTTTDNERLIDLVLDLRLKERLEAMTKQQMIEAFDACSKRIKRAWPDATPCEMSNKYKSRRASLLHPTVLRSHLLFMCVAGKQLIEEGRTEKAGRWLGFVQGVMWCKGDASIEAMRKMNMPKECKP